MLLHTLLCWTFFISAAASNAVCEGLHGHCLCPRNTTCAGPANRCHTMLTTSVFEESERESITQSFYDKACIDCGCTGDSAASKPQLPWKKKDSFPIASNNTSGPLLDIYRDKLLRYPICRIYDVCIVGGKFKLSNRLRDFQNEITECGLSNVEFVDSPSELPVSQLFTTLDLFGVVAQRAHFPHFVTDALWILHAYGIWFGAPQPAERERYARHCLAWDPQARRPVPTPCTADRLNLAPLLHLPLASDVSAWIRGFASMLFARFGGFSVSDHVENSCFRSIAVSRNEKYIFMSHPYAAVSVRHPFFEANKIARAPLSKAQRRTTQDSDTCTINITIVTRLPESGRVLEGIEDLSAALKERCSRYQVQRVCQVKIATFENTSIAHQRDVMQQTDIAIFAHGAAVANMVFMRFGSMVLEIFPFGYQPQLYAHMANILGIRYRAVSGTPDDATFRECMMARPNADRANGIVDARDTLLHMWDTAVEQWQKHRTFLPIGLEQHHVSDGYQRVRNCVRLQRVRVDQTLVAGLIFEEELPYC